MLPKRQKFEIDFRSVPRGMEANYVAFLQIVEQRFTCGLCGSGFSPRQSGTLLCSFHPLAHYETGERMTPYLNAERPSPCATCSDKNLVTQHRRVQLYDSRSGSDGISTSTYATVESAGQSGELILVAQPEAAAAAREQPPFVQADAHSSLGCVAVDHCLRIADLLAQPYVALPLVYFSKMVLSTLVNLERPEETPEYAWLVVDTATDLIKSLEISLPYLQTPFRESVYKIYELMALKFGIESLEDGARAARVYNNKSSLSQLKSLHHPDAERKDLLHKIEQRRVQFVPFIIVCKLGQNFVNSRRMRIV